MKHPVVVLVLLPLGACAEPPPARAPEPAATPVATATAPAPTTTQTASPKPVPVKADVPPPPLSTPNPLAAGKSDAGTDAAADPSDPRTAGIRHIGQAAQECHAKHAPGIKGRLTLRIVPDRAGAVKSVSVVKAKSSAELARPAFESCVLDAVKKEKLSPARDEDDEVELPLTFEPNP